MDLAAHKELVRKQFAIQAKHYEETMKFRHGESIVPLLDLAQPQKTDRVLDVASGTGLVAMKFSPRARAVLGVDLLPEMVALAKRFTAERKMDNVEYLVGDGEDLKLQAGSFEIVTCRFTFHHFGDAAKALSEMKRVLAPGGRIILYDFLASAEPAKAKLHNEVELARDPSHVRIYTLVEFGELFKQAGLKEDGRITTLMKRDYDQWMSYVAADDDLKLRVRRMLELSVPGDKTGLGVRAGSRSITFSHTCICWRLSPSA